MVMEYQGSDEDMDGHLSFSAFPFFFLP